MEEKRIRTKNRPEVVVITGASAGVGRATARRFAKMEHGLACWRGTEGLESARQDVETLGGKAFIPSRFRRTVFGPHLSLHAKVFELRKTVIVG